MATIILFCCDHVAVEVSGAILKTNDLDSVLRAIAETDSAIVLLGPEVPAGTSRVVVDAVVNRGGYFLHVNVRDSSAWLRRMIRFALKPR